MNFRNISAWSIKNPIVPLLMFVGLLLAGMVSFSRMEVQDNPDIEFPLVIVNISLPGAAPTEIENQITQRVEAAVNTINGVDQITSTAQEGSSQTQIQFDLGTNINEAVNDVKNQIDQIRGELPDGILEPYVFRVETSNNTLVYYGISADDMTMEQLSWFVDDTVKKRLLSIEGLAEVDRAGGVDREILVILDPAKMQSLGVTATQVNQTLRGLNINAAGGRAEIAGSRQSVRVLGNALSAYDLSQTQISLGNGRTVKLSDIASVKDKYGEVTSISLINGKPVVTFGVSRARGASDVTVYDDSVKVLKQIEKENAGIKFTRLYTTVDYTKDQYESSIAAMIEGAVLAVIVVFFFLRDWRATVIAALAIPLSAIPTFWFMDMLGFTLNQMSLLALGLVAGVLVDDAIVEIENIVRHMRMGKSAYQASIDAADEIGLAVVATTFSIVAVFFPVALMPGVAGQFFKNFGLTVVVSVLMSLAVARMITPMVAAYFLKAHGHAEHGGGRLMNRYLSVLHWSLSEGRVKSYRAKRQREDGSVGILTRIASRFLDHRMWMMGIGVIALILTVACAIVMPKQFFPDADSDFSRLTIEMAPGTTIEQTGDVTHKIAAILRKQPEVDFVLERVREGESFIMLTLAADRKRSSIEFEREITPILQKVPDARINFEGNNPGSGGRPIQVMLSGSDPEALTAAAGVLAEQMKGVQGAVSPRVDADIQRPEIIVKPREDLASSLGVSTSAISQTIRIATLGDVDQNAAKFSLSDRQIPIRVRLSEDARRDVSVIRNLPVQTGDGGSVPLSRVADISFGSGPTKIDRYNQQRRIFVSADLAPDATKGTVMDRINALPIMRKLPTGISNAPFGEDKFQAEMVANFGVALVTGVFLVFGVLVLLYHRLVSPLVNMSSLFLAPLGGFIVLICLGQPLSLPVFIGILMLFGIVAKNSILLIDFAIEEMATGATRFDAIIEAGHKRAQPIVMTTVAMTAGMVPTAISLSGDSAWRAPMGMVVIGGLLLSTLLTLLIVPAGFSLADGLEKRIGPWLRTRLLTYDPKHEDKAPSHTHPAE